MRKLALSPSYDSFRSNIAGFALSTFKKTADKPKYTNDEKHAYNASQAAYGSYEHYQQLKLHGYDIDNDLSTHNTKIYANGENAIVAYRGTVSDPEDLSADVAIAGGIHNMHDAFWTAKAVGERASKKYKNVLYTGHSLGGTKAIETSKIYGGQAVVFNPGSSPTRKLNVGNAKVYRTNQDYISYNTNAVKPVVVKGSHSLSDFEKVFDESAEKQ